MNVIIKTLFTILLLVSCNNETKQQFDKKNNINTLKNNYSDSCSVCLKETQKLDTILLKSTNFNESLAIKANNTFVKCAFICNHDSISPLYLIKSAQLCQTLNKIELSEKYLIKIIEDYPKSKFVPVAKLLLAQYYADENLLNNPQKARELFNNIIREYPQTVWAENAAAAINWIGKSDEEIIKEIKKKK